MYLHGLPPIRYDQVPSLRRQYLDLLDVESREVGIHLPHFNPHGPLDVSDGDDITEERRSAVTLGGAPLDHQAGGASGAGLEGRRGRGGGRCITRRTPLT